MTHVQRTFLTRLKPCVHVHTHEDVRMCADKLLCVQQVSVCTYLPLPMFQFCLSWRQRFVIWVSDLCFSSPSFSTSDNPVSISSDESPCRAMPIRFWVDQTHVSTDFPKYHRTEFLTWTIELRPISNRIPECCHHEEQQRIYQRNLILYHQRSHSKVVVDHKCDLSSS